MQLSPLLFKCLFRLEAVKYFLCISLSVAQCKKMVLKGLSCAIILSYVFDQIYGRGLITVGLLF